MQHSVGSDLLFKRTTLVVERLGRGGRLGMGAREEAPVRIQRGAAGGLDLGGIDRGGGVGSDSESQGAAEEISDG